ncbi:MarR family winged helix-turn-helix transcriptional regulator [Nocardia sp. NBC_00565]|uniref:MarR family winged helix-turn-helix transcriptional regulator n=1 Tax=Nocardia sp. NBC_00565 TaxID=2975993 RepID=UPI002E8209CF|nr:MarR family winged helix-turn-helix transcriptional regulator [Nocardia sp. NBC_00565]WUC01785.1 MarR family winged helix-turn-helix transcriptional regulator [Nocardia sp. NBC_00565]
MPLTETQVKVLAALAGLLPTEALTVQQLSSRTGFAASTVRAILGSHSYDGFASGSRRRPVVWRITARGRSLLCAPGYRDFLPYQVTTTNGAKR